MILTIYIIYLAIFYLSIPGLLHKAGYGWWLGLIPVYNVYKLFEVLKINIIIFLALIIGIISPISIFFLTLSYIFFPFLITDAYGKKYLTAFLTLLFPFIMYPLIAYKIGNYSYMED